MVIVQPSTMSGGRGSAVKCFKISSDRGDLNAEVFFAVPKKFEFLLSDKDDGILPLAAVLALVRGEDAEFQDIRVDAALLRNARAGVRQLTQWYPSLRTPVLHADTETNHSDRAPNAAAFLSGGVDSQFTLLRHSLGSANLPGSAIGHDLSYCFHVVHTPLLDAEEAHWTVGSLARTAASREVDFVPVQSNMMTVDRYLSDRWADVGHGAGLASLLHVMSGGVGTGLIASTHSYGSLMPWGSSPVVDPLWSGDRLRVVHDGSTFTRVEKTMLISNHPVALDSINVCDRRVDGVGYVNCGRCQKCLRTMITLDLSGKAGPEVCASFDWTGYDPRLFGNVFLRTPNEVAFAKEIRDASLGKRPDITKACERALLRSRLFRPLSYAENSMKNSRFGRRNRRMLKNLQKKLYRSAGWAGP